MTAVLAATFTGVMRRLLMLPPEASQYAVEVDRLHIAVILTTFAGASGVFLLALFFIIRYRQRDPDQTTVHVPPSRLVEAAYILGPLSLFVLWFFIGFSQYVRAQTPPPDAMDVYVTAKQWMWKFTYPEGPSSIGTLRVPVGKPIRLLITSRDVIHSFFVPELRLKQDAVPGRYTQVSFTVSVPGSWRILCTEYCGLLHSHMWGELVALPPAEYGRWLAEQQQGLVARRDASASPTEAVAEQASMAEQGRRAAGELGCLQCHSANGARATGPTWQGLYMSRVPLHGGGTVIADEAYLTESMMQPDAKIVEGFPAVMPSFQGKMGPAETAAIVEFIKSLASGEGGEAAGPAGGGGAP